MQRSHVRSQELFEEVLPSAAPHGDCPSDSDTVGVCSRVSAQRAGRKRVAELALALLTHWLMPESNHHLVFTEHLSWKAGNPLSSCFVPQPVPYWGIFILALGSISSPLISPASPAKGPKGTGVCPLITPSLHFQKKPSVSTTLLQPLTHFL